jgi:hypothetical protein
MHTDSLQPSMSLLRDKAFTILSLHRGGQYIKPRLDAHLEQLLGGAPVVLKKSQPTACKAFPLCCSSSSLINISIGSPENAPQYPERTDMDMHFDLQALIGIDEGPINAPMNAPSFNQPIPASTFNGPVPNYAQVMEGMGDFDSLLFGYLNEQQTNPLGQPPTNNWDDLVIGALS